MTNKNDSGKNHYLSDLLDDCANDEAIEHLLADKDGAEKWFRYNKVRAVLTQENSVHSSFDFTQSISAKIALEPSIIARPSSYAKEAVQTPSVVVNLWKKAGGGLAIAASVAFAMVFSVQLMNTSPSPGMSASLDTAVNDPFTGQLESINFSPVRDAEQVKLDEIQSILDTMNRQSLTMNEQLVGGEIMVQSFVVTTKDVVDDKTSQFESQVRNMKKPSEASNR